MFSICSDILETKRKASENIKHILLSSYWLTTDKLWWKSFANTGLREIFLGWFESCTDSDLDTDLSLINVVSKECKILHLLCMIRSCFESLVACIVWCNCLLLELFSEEEVLFWLKSGLDWLVVTMEEEGMMVLSGTFLDSRDERNDELLVLGVLGENKTLLSLLVAGSDKSCVRY